MVEFVECDVTEHNSPMKQNHGSFEMSVDEADAISIDNCEKAALRTSYEAIRDALFEHLSAASQKKTSKKRKRK
jgi:hypothetical protein